MAMVQAPTGSASGPRYPNPYEDIPSWWSYFFSGGYSWRWFSKPHLYFRPGLEYKKTESPFTVIDGLGREKTYDRPFECYIDPATGKIETLYVQAPGMLCRMSSSESNCTWKRTPINNVTPILLRIANIPYRAIPAKRRSLPWSDLTAEDKWKVVLLWLPAVAVFLFSLMTMDAEEAAEKDQTRYLPMMYKGLRYPRLARNLLENRLQVAQRLHDQGGKTVLSSYRTFRPRFLNYIVEVEVNGRKKFDSVRRAVPENDLTPFVMVCYASAHYNLPDADGNVHAQDQDDLERLISVSTKAATQYFQLKPGEVDLFKTPYAFWSSANCMPPGEVADENGRPTPVHGLERERLANQDTYSISDIIRAAKHVIIVAGNISREWDPDALRVWGQRIWTLPEVVLSHGDTVTVWHCGNRGPGQRPVEVREIPKALLPTEAWSDAPTARQLIDHYTNLHLSRLELVKIALECLMSRRFRSLHPGDRVYVLMGLLRIRPPIDKTDTSFQAFARLSLPQDSDRLMERLICLLPDFPEQNWELMADQYKASLWDIYPDTQVCAIGENDTVVVDGAKGAQIQWSHFTKIRALRRGTLKRQVFVSILSWSPLLFLVGIILAIVSAPAAAVRSSFSDFDVPSPPNPTQQAAIAIIVISLLCILPAPYFLRQIFSGKLWVVEPCFFGIEGYVPLEALEERLFGSTGADPKHSRLRWSAYGSPLARHKQGERMRERAVHYRYAENEEQQPLLQAAIQDAGTIDTYPVETLDPTAPCDYCRNQGSGAYCQYHPTVASCQDMSRSPMGKMKVFTLVDTFNMTVTLFYAIRPPTVLLVGGSEGGTKRAIACSFDVTTGTLYRETVLRIPSQSVDRMDSLPRVRLGLRRPFLDGDVERRGTGGGYNAQHYQNPSPPVQVQAPVSGQPQQQYQQGRPYQERRQYQRQGYYQNAGSGRGEVVPVEYVHEPKV
ncbi:hypothetical protein QBC47DRAFT_412412 [Echria macrotheca]|uniref:Uncharacterized protein n=1 Tax=Echria macrotheca TaxID=438768 RepID=A0AAJ0BFR5_9PEZI|nr:hypothetical protein QBC47DRAFT_412412 [Echria macrotheca]